MTKRDAQLAFVYAKQNEMIEKALEFIAKANTWLAGANVAGSFYLPQASIQLSQAVECVHQARVCQEYIEGKIEFDTRLPDFHHPWERDLRELEADNESAFGTRED